MWKGHLRSVVKMTACSSEGVRSHRGQPGSKVPLPQQLGNVSTVGEPCPPWAVVPHSACRWRPPTAAWHGAWHGASPLLGFAHQKRPDMFA